MGTKDLPAVISYISSITDRPGELLYVGHSMGTTMFFAYASEISNSAENVKAMFALAPVAYMTHMKSPLRHLTPWLYDIEFLAKHLGINEFLPSNKILKFLATDCDYTFPKVCENIIFLIAGFDAKEMNSTVLPVILGHDPAGSSSKTVIHYLQEIANKGNFQKYDYGKNMNRIIYGQSNPPLYNISRITVPTYFMYADNDFMTNPIDIKRFAESLKNDHTLYEVKLTSFNHVDFLWANDVVNLVYKPLLGALKNYTTW